MKAGEVFELPDHGDLTLRLSAGDVIVREFDEEYGWGDLCALVDFPALYPEREWELPNLRIL